MNEEEQSVPDRREFVRRLGTAAAYGVPVFAALGTAKSLGAQERTSTSTPEQIATHMREAARHLVAADRLGSRYRFRPADWEVIEPAVQGLAGPVKGWPPKWCTIC